MATRARLWRVSPLQTLIGDPRSFSQAKRAKAADTDWLEPVQHLSNILSNKSPSSSFYLSNIAPYHSRRVNSFARVRNDRSADRKAPDLHGGVRPGAAPPAWGQVARQHAGSLVEEGHPWRPA